MMKKTILCIISVILLTAILIIPNLALSTQFRDIPTNGWEIRYVNEMVERGIMIGTSSNTFDPDSEININTVSTVLYRLAGSPEITYFTNEHTKGIVEAFKDPIFAYQSWSHNPVLWASLNGIVMLYAPGFTGTTIYSNGSSYRYSEKFEREVPEKYADEIYDFNVWYIVPFPEYLSFTRGDIIMSLYFFAEYMNLDVTVRGDITSFKDSVKMNANKDGIYVHDYDPLSYGYFPQYHLNMSEYWSWAVGCGIVNGYPDGTLSQNKPVTRAEFAAMISRYIDYYNIK